MDNFQPNFLKKPPINFQNNIYNFLGEEVKEDVIKATEINTYSYRAKDFDEKNILSQDHLLKIPLLRILLKYPQKTSLFLELAGGDGRFALDLMRRGYKVIESDIALGSVQKVYEFAKKLNLERNNYFCVIDACDTPFKDQILDAIFIVAALHHLPNPNKALAECFRVLKHGGCLLILREPASWQYKIFGPFYRFIKKIIRKKRREKFISLADDVTQGFSKKQLFQLAKKAGFSQVGILPVHYTEKFYTNFLILKEKLLKNSARENKTIRNIFKRIDQFIAKIPLIKLLSWDWDLVCYKK